MKPSVASRGFELNINPSTIMSSDIHQMLHYPDESKVEIILNKIRECPHPQVIGRLSGPALGRLLWETMQSHHADYDIITGYYTVPWRGQYFIEIIVHLCTELLLETDVRDICLVDPSHHRLTANDSFINITHPSGSFYNNHIGYWYWSDVDKPIEPLFTRYQPPGCRNGGPHCKVATDISRFDPYKFHFLSLPDLKSTLSGKERKLCWGGASHAQVLRDYSVQILKSLDNSTVSVSSSIHVEHVQSAFAAELNSSAHVQKFIDTKCTHVILGSGQWDAGWPESKPTSFQEYEEILNSTVPLILEILSKANIDVYYRSMHYNPLGDMILHCPPTDWRSPSVVDMYNKITQRVCKLHGMKWIDTNEIMGIMWDRAEDWCHYRDFSSSAEAMYFLSYI
jgi:hypothetical protein